MTKVEPLPFKPRARIILQLGDQLIRNERIALFELVKNSYDADASEVKIILSHIESMDKGEIIVHDDGSGMSLNTVVNVWMEPGTDYRANQFQERTRTPKFGRLPIGEKGIGLEAAARYKPLWMLFVVYFLFNFCLQMVMVHLSTSLRIWGLPR